MKRSIVFIIILSLPGFLGSQALRIDREIDLSRYLRPHQPHRAVAAVDSLGNIFIAQRGNDSFIKMDPAGQIVLRAPQKNEGEIVEFDIDRVGNPVCLFRGRVEGASFVAPLIWFDGVTGDKIREVNLGQDFSFVAQMRILRPRDIILVNGIAKGEMPPGYSLHLVDFNGNRLGAFSPFEKRQGDILTIIDANRDSFGSPILIDPDNMTIFQAFPSTGLIRYFNYAGHALGETEWMDRNTFLIHSGSLWFRDEEGYRVVEKKENRFVPTEKRIKDDTGTRVPWYPVSSDSQGNLYFLGNREFQTLKIYSVN